MGKTICVMLVCALVAGCGNKKGKGEADKAKAKAKVDLQLEGAVTAKLAGEAGECRDRSGTLKGAISFSVRSTELGVKPAFSLDINGLKGAKSGTAVRLFMAKPRLELVRSNVSPPAGDKAMIKDDLTIEVDSTLGVLSGTSVKTDGKSVHIKGTVKCPPLEK